MIDFVKENAALVVDALEIVTDKLSIGWIIFYIASYILLSLGLSALAKRRAIDRPWLAWIPVGNLWILGCLADQYSTVVKGKQKANSKDRLFWWGLGSIALLVAVIVLLAVGLSYLTEQAPVMSVPKETLAQLDSLSGDQLSEAYFRLMAEMAAANEDVARTVNTGLIGLMILLIAYVVAAIALAVEMYKALYFLYASSLPKHAVWFLVVSIVLGVEAIFVFICRKQHQGMPHDKKGHLQVV